MPIAAFAGYDPNWVIAHGVWRYSHSTTTAEIDSNRPIAVPVMGDIQYASGCEFTKYTYDSTAARYLSSTRKMHKMHEKLYDTQPNYGDWVRCFEREPDDIYTKATLIMANHVV